MKTHKNSKKAQELANSGLNLFKNALSKLKDSLIFAEEAKKLCLQEKEELENEINSLDQLMSANSRSIVKINDIIGISENSEEHLDS